MIFLYIDDLELIRDYKALSDQEKEEVIGQYALSAMLGNADGVEIFKSGGRIYQVDFADTFNMSTMMLKMAYGMNQVQVRDNLLKGYRESFARDTSQLKFNFSFLEEHLGMWQSQIEEIAIRIAKRILDVTEEDIKDIEHELLGLYPLEYVFNYIEDIRVLQEKMGEYA